MKKVSDSNIPGKKQLVLSAINRQKVDFFPTQIDMTSSMREVVKRHYDIKENLYLSEFLHNHLFYLLYNDKVLVDEQNGISYDIFLYKQ